MGGSLPSFIAAEIILKTGLFGKDSQSGCLILLLPNGSQTIFLSAGGNQTLAIMMRFSRLSKGYTHQLGASKAFVLKVEMDYTLFLLATSLHDK